MTNILNHGILGFSVVQDSDVILATHISHALLGGVINDKIFLKTPKGHLSCDGMFITVGNSGTEKSIPLMKAIRIARDLGIEIPSKFTTEGLSDYFSIKKDGVYCYKPYGIIFWDEVSKYFSESITKQFLNGMIESMSCLYNHYIPKEYYKSYQPNNPQNPYVSMIGNMVPQYIKEIPDYFWNQGLAGRILWRYITPSQPKKDSWRDFTYSDKSQEELNRFKEDLIKIKNELEISNAHIIFVDEESDGIIQDFKFKVETQWFENYFTNPFDINYAYKKRLTELLGKTALRIAVGRYYYEHNEFKGFKEIVKSDVELGIKIINQNMSDLETIFNLSEMSKLPKEEIYKNTKKNKVLDYIDKGYTVREMTQFLSNYKDKTPVPEIISEFLGQRLIKLKDKDGHYERL